MEDGMRCPSNESSVRLNGGLQNFQLLVNALQSGKDVQLSLSTLEDGLLQVALINPPDNQVIGEGINDENAVKENVLSDVCSIQDTKTEGSKTTGKDLADLKAFQLKVSPPQIATSETEAIAENTEVIQSPFTVDQPGIDDIPLHVLVDNNSTCSKSLGSGLANYVESENSVRNVDDKASFQVDNVCSGSKSHSRSTVIVAISTDEDEQIETVKNKMYRPMSSPSPIDPSEFPCVRPEWYIIPPKHSNKALVDEQCEINTSMVASDLRRFLRHHSIRLTKFSQSYLQRSQGTLSDLLNHPKPWTDLSPRGKSTYHKMMQFLNAENLHEVVSQLKEGYENVRRGPPANVLPTKLLQLLERKEKPSEDYLISVSNQYQLNIFHLEAYCAAQLKKNRDSMDVVVEFGEEDTAHCVELQPSESSQSSSKQSLKKVKALRSGFKPRYNEKHICPVFGCGYILGCKPSLRSHLVLHSGEKPYKCDICEKRFSTNSNMKSHERRHAQLNHKISKRAKNVALLREKTEVFSDDEVLDPLLEKQSEDATTKGDVGKLASSIKLHKSSKRSIFPCNLCRRHFSSRQLLHKHTTDTHTKINESNKRVMLCHLCSNTFKSKSSLLVHLRTHDGYRPFQCKICKKRFHTKTNCSRHFQSHLGIKAYKCPKCPARFVFASSIPAHLRIHTGEKPFECETCGKRFVQCGPLSSHRKLHTKSRIYLCHVCGIAFRYKSNLHIHEQRHCGEKRFKCHECSRNFYSKCDLERHMLKHSGLRPFACTQCSMDFTRINYLRDHIRKAHNAAPYGSSSFPCKDTTEYRPSMEAVTGNVQTSEKISKNENDQPVVPASSSDNDDYTSILRVLSDAIYVTPISPADPTTPAAATEVNNTISDDSTTSLRTTNTGTGFAIHPGNSGLAIVTSRGIVFATPSSVESTLLEASASDGGLNIISKLPLSDREVGLGMVDVSDPNMQSVIVAAAEDNEQLQEGTRYVVVGVAGEMTSLNPNPELDDV